MGGGYDRLDPRDDDRDKRSFWERLTPTLKKIDRAILAAAHWLFRIDSLVAFMLAGLVITTVFILVPAPYGGIVHEAERLVLPTAERVLAVLGDQLRNAIEDQNWRQAMRYMISSLVILSVLFHAVLVGEHIWEKLSGRLKKKHPIRLWGAVATSTILIATAAVPEFGHLIT